MSTLSRWTTIRWISPASSGLICFEGRDDNAERHQQPDPGRDHEPGGRSGNPAKDILKNRMVSLREVQHANREPDHPWDHQETGGGGDRADGASQSCPDADRNADDVRAGHELAKADDVPKFPLADPPTLVDGDAVCPDETAAEPAQRDLEECDE